MSQIRQLVSVLRPKIAIPGLVVLVLLLPRAIVSVVCYCSCFYIAYQTSTLAQYYDGESVSAMEEVKKSGYNPWEGCREDPCSGTIPQHGIITNKLVPQKNVISVLIRGNKNYT